MMLAENVYFPPLIKVEHFDRCDERHKNDLRARAGPTTELQQTIPSRSCRLSTNNKRREPQFLMEEERCILTSQISISNNNKEMFVREMLYILDLFCTLYKLQA